MGRVQVPPPQFNIDLFGGKKWEFIYLKMKKKLHFRILRQFSKAF
jgi:hypothetical protein